MGTTKELRMGTMVEREHRGTVIYIRDYVKKFGRVPPSKKIFKQIASNHLREDPNYYSKLRRAKL